MTAAHVEQVLSLQWQVASVRLLRRVLLVHARSHPCWLLLPTQQRCRSTAVSYRRLRSIGKTGGHDPALMTPSLSKPWRSYRGIFLALVLSR